MGTNAGLTRYSTKGDFWTQFTRADGMIAPEVRSLGFDREDFFLGTPCDGLALGTLKGGGFRIQRNLRRWDDCWTAGGSGLPTDQIAQVVVGREGNVFVATSSGLVTSLDRGLTWRFTRGKDYPAKARGLAAGVPAGFKAPGPGEFLLPEDYVTCMAEDEEGYLWLGFRKKGVLIFDPKTNRAKGEFGKGSGLPDDYVSALLPLADGSCCVGTYGGGYAFVKRPGAPVSQARPAPGAEVAKIPPFPTPTQKKERKWSWDLERALKDAEAAKKADKPFAVALEDDWETRGNWIGKYGEFYHVLCAVRSPFDHTGGARVADLSCCSRLGEHTRDFPLKPLEFPVEIRKKAPPEGAPIPESLRAWIHFMRTDYEWALQLPKELGGGRRQAEWDDHGECYAAEWDGPHLYWDFRIGEEAPEDGAFVLSLYFVNKDGHAGANRYRDYLVSVKPLREEPLKDKPAGWERAFGLAPALATSRVVDFRGGVYKRFLIRRGGYTLRIDKNGSLNTILSGIFLEKTAKPKVAQDVAGRDPKAVAEDLKRLLEEQKEE